MITYKEFLEHSDVISEEEFNNLVNTLPEIENLDDFSVDVTDIEDVAMILIDTILKDFDWVYVDSINVDKLELELGDVKSVEDLEEIKKLFSKWEITNYEELKSDLEQEEKEAEEQKGFNTLINIIRSKASLEDLEKIIKEYGY